MIDQMPKPPDALVRTAIEEFTKDAIDVRPHELESRYYERSEDVMDAFMLWLTRRVEFVRCATVSRPLFIRRFKIINNLDNYRRAGRTYIADIRIKDSFKLRSIATAEHSHFSGTENNQ